MFNFSRLTFQQQVAGLVGLLCVTMVGVLVTGAIWIGRRDAVRIISDDMTELASNMAASLDVAMNNRAREVAMLAGSKSLRAAWSKNPDTIRDAMGELQATLPAYAWIGFAGRDGTVRAATKGMLEGQSVAARPWFSSGSLGLAFEDVHEAKLLATVLGPRREAEPFRFVDVAMPVYDETGASVGVLGAHLSWDWAQEVRERLLVNNPSGKDTEIWVLSKDGGVILGPNYGSKPFPAEQFAALRAKGSGTFEDRTGPEPMLIGHAVSRGLKSFSGLGWTVVARRPARVAFSSVQDMILGIAFLGAGVAILSVFLAGLLARGSTAPLRQLTSIARQIGRDPTTTMLPRLEGSKEVVELSTSLRSLLRRIGAAEHGRDEAERRTAMTALLLEEEISTLQQAANTDPLTGLLNRRAFLVYADDAMTYYRRYGRSIAVLIVDIDHFKKVNDTYGHGAGDEGIKCVGAVITEAVRTTDRVARFGGEEFVVLLREIEEGAVRMLAERIRASVAATSIRHGADEFRVTISIGAALVAQADPDVSALIERADAALYAAKNGGRNRVKFSLGSVRAELPKAA